MSTEPVQVQDLNEWQQELAGILAAFRDAKETEDNWEARDRALSRFRSLLAGHVYALDGFMETLKPLMEHLLQTLTSLRSSLLSTCCATISDLAVHLGPCLDPYVERLICALLKLITQSKRLVVSLGSTAIMTILRNTTLHAKVMERFLDILSGKNTLAREKTAEFVLIIVEEVVEHPQNMSALTKGSGMETLEKCLLKGLEDAGASTRERCRRSFELYQQRWPDRAEKFVSKLEPRTVKMLTNNKNSSNQHARKRAIRDAISSQRLQSNTTRDEFDVIIYTKEPPNNNQSNVNDTAAVVSSPKSFRTPQETSFRTPQESFIGEEDAKHDVSHDLLPEYSAAEVSFIHATTPGYSKENVNFSFDADNNSQLLHHLDQPKLTQTSSPMLKNQMYTNTNDQLTPKAANSVGGLAGARASNDISFTPFFRHTKSSNILQTPLPAEPMMIGTPKCSGDGDKYLQHMQNRLSEVMSSISSGHMNDDDFKKLYKFSKDYATVLRQENTNSDRFAALTHQQSYPKNRHMAAAIVWHSNFPMVLRSLLGQFDGLASTPETIHKQEYCAIILNFMIEQHPDLFVNSMQDFLNVILRVRSYGEPVDIASSSNLSKHAAIFSAIQDALDNCVALFDSVLFGKLLSDYICQSSATDPVVGVAFRTLAQLVLEKFNKKHITQLHELVIQPLFYSGTIERIIPGSPVISNRKSVFDFLTALWKVLGDELINRYLAPDLEKNQYPHREFKGLSPANFKLFQIILQQSQPKLRI